MTCKKTLPLLLVLSALVFTGAVYMHSNSKYRTVYLARCMMSGFTTDNCPVESFLIHKVDFLILSDSQMVVRKSDDPIIETMNACSVYDEDNWNCLAPGMVLAMRDGIYKDAIVNAEPMSDLSAAPAKTMPVSAFAYWRYTFLK